LNFYCILIMSQRLAPFGTRSATSEKILGAKPRRTKYIDITEFSACVYAYMMVISKWKREMLLLQYTNNKR
jgi:hypothetical protein